jgi:hypothetical protein
MSLLIDFAALAEGVAADSRGSLTLVGVNAHLLLAEQLPAQFSPTLVVVVVDGDAEHPVLVEGRTVSARFEAKGPDGETIFVTQVRQQIAQPVFPSLRPRLQLIAQVPFTATKPGEFIVSANVTVTNSAEEVMGTVTATKQVRVSDAASIRQSQQS